MTMTTAQAKPGFCRPDLDKPVIWASYNILVYSIKYCLKKNIQQGSRVDEDNIGWPSQVLQLYCNITLRKWRLFWRGIKCMGHTHHNRLHYSVPKLVYDLLQWHQGWWWWWWWWCGGGHRENSQLAGCRMVLLKRCQIHTHLHCQPKCPQVPIYFPLTVDTVGNWQLINEKIEISKT